jgi:hypothetical protein
MAPRNRKERRAAAAASNSAADDSIPLALPSREPRLTEPDVKTLYQIAAEREAGSSATSLPNTEFIQVSPSGELSIPKSLRLSSTKSKDGLNLDESDSTDADSSVPPLPDTLLSSFPLSILHLTLSFLAVRQFGQDTRVKDLIRDTVFVAFPALTFLIHLAHGHILSFDTLNTWKSRKNKEAQEAAERAREAAEDTEPTPMRALFPLTARNFIFLLISLLLGARLIAISNDAGYYAVMKKAPPIGTLWVWAVMEMSAGFSALGLLLPLGWAVLWKGYGIM